MKALRSAHSVIPGAGFGLLSIVVLLPGIALAQILPMAAPAGPIVRKVRPLRWSDMQAAGQLSAGEVVERPDSSPSEQLIVEVSPTSPAPVQILTLDDPGVGAPGYVIYGNVKCEGITSPGYLELWSHFPDGAAYFTRTRSTSGPMATLDDTADWRLIELPFVMNSPDAAGGESKGPNKLVVNLVLPAGGKVTLSNFELAQYSDKASAQKALNGGVWWDSRVSGIWGAVLGSLVGIVNAAIGVFNSRIRSAKVVAGLLVASASLGGLILLAGIIAALVGQPWVVMMPFLLAGLPGTLVPLFLLPSANRNVQARELRRMQALDVGA